MEEKENKIKEAKKALFNILYYKLPSPNCKLIREELLHDNKCDTTSDCHECASELVNLFFEKCEMKPMVYGEQMIDHQILYSGKYKGYKFYICSLSIYPTAYVKVSENDDYPEWVRDRISCNGGITYAGMGNKLPANFEDGFYLGWDYGHGWDYNYTSNCGVKHTTEEIYEEVKNVINQLIPLEDEVKLKFYWNNNDNICPFCGENKYKYSEYEEIKDDIWGDNWKPKYCPNCGKYMVKEE